MSTHKKHDISKESFALPASWQGHWKIAFGLGGVGLVAAFALRAGDPKRFAFSYLFGFYVFLTIALGALFFVLIQRLTSAGWSVTVRRTAEFCASGLWIFAPLFLPIAMQMHELFPWTNSHGDHGGEHHGALTLVEGVAHAQAPQPTGVTSAATTASALPAGATTAHTAPTTAHAVATAPHAGATAAPHAASTGTAHGPAAGHGSAHPSVPNPYDVEHATLMEKKAAYLNVPFFGARAVLYFVVWALLGFAFFKYSTQEDGSKNPEWTLKAQRLAPVGTAAFALTLTFAAFDWLMGLDPAWFSTIFGVYIFATSVVSSLSVMILLTMALRDAGPLKNVVTVEHYHDLGKLLFGFNVFWAYIGFSQMMLIWYAALPEETPFYHKRWDDGPWAGVSLLVLVGHFVIPFLFLISRNVKRRLPLLRLGALLMLCMHMVDMFWFVMPNYTQSDITLMDLVACACAVLGVGGIYAGWVFFQMTKHSLIPIGDPRLERSVAFQNA